MDNKDDQNQSSTGIVDETQTPEPAPESKQMSTPEPTEKPLYPTMEDLLSLFNSGRIKTVSTQKVTLVLPQEDQMLETPVQAKIANAKSSIYVRPTSIDGEGYGNLGTINVGSTVWVVAQTESFYFFTVDSSSMGWAKKGFFNALDGSPLIVEADKAISPDMSSTTEIFLESNAPTLDDLKKLAADDDTKTVSDKGVTLVLPKPEEMLSSPFRAEVVNAAKAIYVMPKPATDNGYITTLNAGSIVWIVAEKGGYYFFVFSDKTMGWNAKEYFEAK